MILNHRITFKTSIPRSEVVSTFKPWQKYGISWIFIHGLVDFHSRIESRQYDAKPIVRNLGVWFDSSLNMSEHITKLCASAFFYIYIIGRIRKYISGDSVETLVHAFISSRLDHGNSLLLGSPSISDSRASASAECFCSSYLFYAEILSHHSTSL